ncbi:MAG: type II toxin-antitoxin system VapC family toxin [Vicinamibacterales bacterium]
MRLLLDTHAYLWWLGGDGALPQRVRALIDDLQNLVLVSAASAWEIATKHRIGKLPGAAAIVADIEASVRRQGFEPLSVTMRHGQRAGSLPGHHRDPFDRMLIAQAILEDCVVVSNEKLFDNYGVDRLW